jgi:methionine aminopeptidase
MHMPPPILHIPNDNAEPMQVGMWFTIEPIVMMNPKYLLGLWTDGWT